MKNTDNRRSARIVSVFSGRRYMVDVVERGRCVMSCSRFRDLRSAKKFAREFNCAEIDVR